MRATRLPVHRDDRGTLVAIDEGALDFAPRRAFVVTEVPEDTVRGDHIVPCRQTMVLASGTAEVTLRDTSGHVETFTLLAPGDGVELEAGEFVRYSVSPAGTLVVFAAEPYRGTPR